MSAVRRARSRAVLRHGGRLAAVILGVASLVLAKDGAIRVASGRRTLRFRIDDFRIPRGEKPEKSLLSKYVAFDLQVLGQPSPAEAPAGEKGTS